MTARCCTWHGVDDDGEPVACDLEHPNPCGHYGVVPGCGGCDPGAVEYVITDEGVMRAFDSALDMQNGEKP